ncbi:MAG: hypothetical protein WAS55_08815 [Saprospiraceae bacterium]
MKKVQFTLLILVFIVLHVVAQGDRALVVLKDLINDCPDGVWGSSSVSITIIPRIGPAISKQFSDWIETKGTVKLGSKNGTYDILASHTKIPPQDKSAGFSIGAFSKTQSFGTLWDGKNLIILPACKDVRVQFSGVTGNMMGVFTMDAGGSRISISISSFLGG